MPLQVSRSRSGDNKQTHIRTQTYQHIYEGWEGREQEKEDQTAHRFEQGRIQADQQRLGSTRQSPHTPPTLMRACVKARLGVAQQILTTFNACNLKRSF